MADAVVAEGLTKWYGPVYALEGLDMAVPEGTVLGLLGPNGAGKTTTVRILATLLRPDGGRASVAGIDVVRQPDQVRRKIGLSGQYAAVDENLTGYENLEMIGRLYRLSKAAARARAYELLERFELDFAAGRPVKTYSGGMRRRLDLAGALVISPPVIFLDEPTTGLDPRGRLGMWEVISERIRDGATLVLTTQYLEEADRLADRIIVLDKGRVIAQGSPADLKRQIGGERLEVALGDLAETETAALALEGLADLTVDVEGYTISARIVEHGAPMLIEAVRRLDKAGIEPRDIGIHRTTLDDVFLKLTGQAAVS